MNKFKFQIPTTIYFGRNEFERIGKVASITGIKALIVIGRGSVKKHGYLEQLLGYLDQKNITYEVFEGIEPNPRRMTVNEAGMVAKRINADMIIALGGGSVMDASKGVCIVAKTEGDIWDYCTVSNKKTRKVEEALPLICIPTLAATGSEVDGVSVITNMETKQKSAIHSSKIVPKFAIIDPLLTRTVPTDYLVDGAIDIICHCIETYISCKEDNYIPDYITLGLTRTVKQSIERLLENPEDIDARENLSWASSLAMIGLFSGRGGGWPIHEIEHSLSALYDISHGIGLSYLLPSILEFNMEHNEERINKMLGFFFHENTSFYANHAKAITQLKNWLTQIGAIRNLKELGIEKIDIDAVAQNAIDTYGNSEGYIFNIVPMYKEDIITVLEDAFGK